MGPARSDGWSWGGLGMRGIRGVASLVAVLTLVAVGCTSSPTSDPVDGGGGGDGGDDGGGSGEQVTLDFWAFKEGGIGAFLETLEKGFEDENPNIDLSITAYPEENYGVKVDTAIAAGKAPDLIVFPDLDQVREGSDLAARRHRAPSTTSTSRPTCRRSSRRHRGRVRLRLRGPSLLPGLRTWARCRCSTTRTCSTRRGSRTRRRGHP